MQAYNVSTLLSLCYAASEPMVFLRATASGKALEQLENDGFHPECPQETVLQVQSGEREWKCLCSDTTELT